MILALLLALLFAPSGQAPAFKHYSATGPGHYIKVVAAEGRTVTLEDDSLWAVDPRTQFKVAGWKPDAEISVHLTDEDPDFNYILNNGEVDDWTFVTLISQK